MPKMRQRKVPIRTCVGCRSAGGKRGLIRIVRTPTGEASVDPTGRMPGRGAYICPGTECLRKAMKGNKLSRALRVEIPEELVRQIEQIVEQGSSDMDT
ncbi:MAG: YlxR family protein [Armatimonadetes bacterium]|nr:YlxR family protein [Armatimonadota bacterium]